MDLTEEAFKASMRTFFPMILGTDGDFQMYKMDRQRKLVEIKPSVPSSLLQDGVSKNRFRGVVFLKTTGAPTQVICYTCMPKLILFSIIKMHMIRA